MTNSLAMKTLTLCLILLSCACCTGAVIECGPGPETPPTPVEAGAGGVILPAERGGQVAWLGYVGAAGFWTPTPSDVAALERDLRPELERGVADPARLDPYVIELPDYATWIRTEVGRILERLDDYKRQYVGVLDGEGRRRILVRCFPGPAFEGTFTFDDWHEQLAVVSDGGFWYWYAVYDVESRRIVLLQSNGYA